jgi:hemerythrin-like domain-containing protein
METFLNKGIKDICNEYPIIADLLLEFDIGCTTCMVGTCLLKDIVKIHDLPSEQEKQLMSRISEVFEPDYKAPDVEEAHTKPTTQKSKEFKYSPPFRFLVDEHKWIMRLVSLIPKIIDKAELFVNSDYGLEVFNNMVLFIREYADQFHHAKEEDVLFEFFDEDLEIIKVIRIDHTTVRALVKEIVEAIENKDAKIISRNLQKYGEILTEHIKKEDEILYTWMEKALSDKQIGEIYTKFNEIATEFKDAPKKHEEFILNLEEKLK